MTVVESVVVDMVMVVGVVVGTQHWIQLLCDCRGRAANEEPAEEKNVSSGHSGYVISGRDVLR